MFYEDPAHMSADERLDELAALLAAGFLRLKCRMGHPPTSPRRGRPPQQENKETGRWGPIALGIRCPVSRPADPSSSYIPS